AGANLYSEVVGIPVAALVIVVDIDRQLLRLLTLDGGLQTGPGGAERVEKNVVGLAGGPGGAAHVDYFRVGIPVQVRRRFPAGIGIRGPIQADLDGVDGQVGVDGCQLDFVVHEPVRPNRG